MKLEVSEPVRTIVLELDAEEAEAIALAIQKVPVEVRRDTPALAHLFGALCAIRDHRPHGGL